MITGEKVRGFAAVAAEVRSLAQRSASAAKEIQGLIGDSVEKVEAGSKLVTEAGTTMDEIVDSVKRVTAIMAEITTASEEQSSGIEQVNKAIGQMDNVAQQNAALVEEAAAAAESMQDQARKLTEVASIFKVGSVKVIAAPAATAVKPHAQSKPIQPASRPPKALGVPVKYADPKKPAHGASGSNDNREEF